MNKLLSTIILCLLFRAGTVAADSFDDIKKELSQDGCWAFEFDAILVSEIFEITDTTESFAYIASDNRYKIEICDDIYLYDGEYLYSYSPSSNQVIIEPGSDELSRQVSFLTRLDELYNSHIISPDSLYSLTKKKAEQGDFPDSLTVTLSEDGKSIESLEYHDINEELNIIRIRKQTYSELCDSNYFEPSFPEEAERVKL